MRYKFTLDLPTGASPDPKALCPDPTFKFHYQSPNYCQHSTLLQHQVVSAFPCVQNVPFSSPAPFARRSSKCDSLQAIPHHCAATQDLKELEELGGEVDTGRWSDLLLQHLECVR